LNKPNLQKRSDEAGKQAPVPAFLPFTRPELNADDIQAVIDVLKSGWITSGAKVQELEAGICALTGSKHAVAVCSATAGMHIALHSLGIGPGDEVITPSMTWVSTVNLIVLCGATPVFVDVDSDTLMTNAELIAAKITPATRLIIPVHYAGAPLDIEPIRTLAKQHGIALLEDAAHALGSSCRGERVGKSGAAIFSLQAIKNVTSAEGGVICTDDADFAASLRRLRFHGLGQDAFDRTTQGRSPQAEVVEPGFKYNLPDMNACLALGQLHRIDSINGKRQELAEYYRKELATVDSVIPLGLPDYPHEHVWHLFVVRVDEDRMGLTREQFMEALKLRQIGSGIHFKAVHSQKYYRDTMPASALGLENTTWNSDRIVSLPLFPGMSAADVDRVVSAIKDITAEAQS
jgi:UDP-4-amino-4-deoxy-L-arabinose-oxoglutarate aminotransferase